MASRTPRRDHRSPIAAAESSAAQIELVHVARRLHQLGCQTIGLWPTGPSVPVPPLAARLGASLHQVACAPIAVVDGNLRWPATSIAEEVGEDAEYLFVTRWVSEGLALIAPRRLGPPGAGVPQLRLLVQSNRETFAHLIIDLTGYAELGDHLDAIETMDGIVLVARAGLTKESHLLRMSAQLPAERTLGVLIVG